MNIKNTISIAFTTLLFFSSIKVFAEEKSTNINHENFQKIDEYSRIYIAPVDIYIAEGSIYVNLGSVIVPVTTIGTDEKGIFIEGILIPNLDLGKCMKCNKVFNDSTHNAWCPHDKKRK